MKDRIVFEFEGVRVSAPHDRLDDVKKIISVLTDGEKPPSIVDFENQVRWIFLLDGKIQAIKFVRDEKALGLKDAKEYTEALCQDLQNHPAYGASYTIDNLKRENAILKAKLDVC